MAYITNKRAIFFFTSPRSPHKLASEIKFLVENFQGKRWNPEIQVEFYTALSKQDFFEGTATGDLAFKARDRINRAPKALGFVDLKPAIQLTEAGKQYIYGSRPHEVFTRQLLKFQLHSPFHKDKSNNFRIRPYLELMRLIYDLEGLTKYEIASFVMGLTNYNNYQSVKEKIITFREEKKHLRGRNISYKSFAGERFRDELKWMLKDEIADGNLKIRESQSTSLQEFISTKKRNHTDYADAAIRYLRATNLFSINPKTRKIYVLHDKQDDVAFILSNTQRDLYHFRNEDDYKEHLFTPDTPTLLVDNKLALIEKIIVREPRESREKLVSKDIEALKDQYQTIIQKTAQEIVEKEKEKLRKYEEYEDIIQIYEEIVSKENVDPSLFLEWNTWRAFSMLNDGDIEGNFQIDEDGIPLYTAAGNQADIVCRYKDFESIVEVTLSTGQKQYEMEGEPVARHYGQFKRESAKPVFGIFIAPVLNDATIAHYYTLYRTNISYYGGKAKIIPLSLDDFKILLKNAHESHRRPNASDIRLLFEQFSELALQTENEQEWYRGIKEIVQTAFKDTHKSHNSTQEV